MHALRAGRGAHCPSVFVCVAHLSLEMTALFIYLLSRRTQGSRRRRSRGGRNTGGNPVFSCHDAPEGDPSASIISGGTSVRRESGPDLSNDMTWRQMIAVGVRRVVLARGELDKLEGPKYAARRAELRRKAKEAARTRDRQAAAASQNEAEESGATEEEATGGRTMRVGRPRGGMKVAARIGEGLRREIGRGRRPRVGDG